MSPDNDGLPSEAELDALLNQIDQEKSGQKRRAAAEAAAKGRDATRDMVAKRGRAKHVEGAGVGHVDAGATSVAALLALFAEWEDR